MDRNEQKIRIDVCIHRAKAKMYSGLWTLEFAKGYCFGALDATVEDDDLYDELSKLIDEIE